MLCMMIIITGGTLRSIFTYYDNRDGQTIKDWTITNSKWSKAIDLSQLVGMLFITGTIKPELFLVKRINKHASFHYVLLLSSFNQALFSSLKYIIN